MDYPQDADRAECDTSELIVVAHCLHCEIPRVAMHHKLDQPFPVSPYDAWLRKIQGTR